MTDNLIIWISSGGARVVAVTSMNVSLGHYS